MRNDYMGFMAQPHHLQPGGAAPYLKDFAAELAAVGYTSLVIHEYLLSATHFGGWLESRGLALEQIDEFIVQAFADHSEDCPGRRRHKRVSRDYVVRVRRFIDHLCRRGEVPALVHSSAAEGPVPPAAFRDWLVGHRGLALPTIERHQRLITRLLPALGTDPATYDAAGVRRVALAEVRGCGRAQAKTIVSSLRVYLRFLAARGECRPGLDRALPPLPQWRLSALPRYLDASAVDRLLAACDLRQAHGVRDRAILLLLVRLGLRAGDIVALHLDDIDWREATLRVRGKGRRQVRLPLPQEAGDALLAYLEHARPKVAIDRVFLCANAPWRSLLSGSSVSGIVRLALRRAGIDHPPTRGANLLRHTAATLMLRAGATLDTIGAVLRHRSPDTTAHYAKVDVALLQPIAQPWPEEDTPC